MPKQHIFKEYRFEPDGELNGFRCAIQEFQCKSCGIIIELPMGVSPNDYHNGTCKGGQNVNETNNSAVYGDRMPDNNRMRSGNTNNVTKNGLRRL